MLVGCRAQLVATITGHGHDTPHGCAEFCDSRVRVSRKSLPAACTPPTCCAAFATSTTHAMDLPSPSPPRPAHLQHVFSINGASRALSFPTAGTEMGCTSDVLAGTTPNEHGTWFFGRGGWCNGRQVDPWWVACWCLVPPAACIT
jgi:hypothetical protein